MKYLALLLLLASCAVPVGIPDPPAPAPVVVPDPVVTPAPVVVADTPDARLTLLDASSAKWIRKPVTAKVIVAASDPVAMYCTDPGWSYLFYDDLAVIGYEPLPGQEAQLHVAANITVEIHNRDNPGHEWDVINVNSPPPPDPTVVTPDPDPLPPAGHVYYLTKTHAIFIDYTFEPGPRTWSQWLSAVALDFEITNRDRPADDKLHQVTGAAP